MFNKRGL
jgi:hypothetical protein